MQTVIDCSPKKSAICPFCAQNMTYKGDGRYVCPTGCGEFLREHVNEDQQTTTMPVRAQQYWPELFEGTSGRMRQALKSVADMHLGTTDVVGPCQGHGGKGGGKSSSGGKSPARQKMDSWKRRTAPGRFIRSARIG